MRHSIIENFLIGCLFMYQMAHFSFELRNIPTFVH